MNLLRAGNVRSGGAAARQRDSSEIDGGKEDGDFHKWGDPKVVGL